MQAGESYSANLSGLDKAGQNSIGRIYPHAWPNMILRYRLSPSVVSFLNSQEKRYDGNRERITYA